MVSLSEQAIKSRASKQSYSRGKTYFNDEQISSTIRRKNEIEAYCNGSYPEPYRVWAKIVDGDIIATSCTCEYDWGGDCKHIVAMLLTYLHHSEQFEEKPPLHDALLKLKKEDLVELIEQMITRYPDLQDIVDRPVPSENIATEPNINLQTFRRELSRSLEFSGEWMDRRAESKVYEIAKTGERFARRGDHRNAIAIYCTIIEECNDNEYPTDDEGDFVSSVNYTIELLRSSLLELNLTNHDMLRQQVINALLGAFIWDVDFGGIDYGYEATDILLEIVQPEDVADIRAAIDVEKKIKAQESYGKWGVEAYERFLIELDTLSSSDPEETLKRLEEQGLDYLLVSKLLQLERVECAVEVIRERITGSYELIRVLGLLKTHEEYGHAITLAEERLEQEYDNRVAHWLIELSQETDDHQAEFKWQLKRMEADPSLEHYASLKIVANKKNVWDVVRPQVIQDLTQKKSFDVLTLAYLDDEAWDLAWETLEKVSSPTHHHPSWAIYRLDFTVAQKSRHARPQQAIPVYIKYARAEIDIRNRKHYARAAQLLTDVQQMYQQLNDSETWKQLIADLRSEFKRLPAFQDELNKAGL